MKTVQNRANAHEARNLAHVHNFPRARAIRTQLNRCSSFDAVALFQCNFQLAVTMVMVMGHDWIRAE